ncbi:MAG: methionine--tRNA ligase [Planctomycetes bacterium]|nr:methionine--tRNA ligase [Planctomycetota bacterium]
MPENVIVTSALPYANGPIHFGHVVGAYLPADIYVRFRRMRGDHVHFVCGTDEHGVAITLKAEQAGKDYQAYVDHWHKEIRRTLEELVGIRFDAFSGTSHARNPHHRELAQRFFLDLLHNGYLFEKTEEQFFSPSLGRFLPDRYVEGTCYLCGFDEARGDECPRCGKYLDARRLANPLCTIDGQPPVLKATKHWYLDLPKLKQEWVQGWFEGKAADWKANVKAFVANDLEELRERPETRDLPWGVPVPLPGTDGKVLYVWFDAPIGYLSISKQYFAERGEPERFERLWKDPSTRLIHFVGKDNITFHCLIFPAMLYGTKAGWIVPANVPANEFFQLEGRKFNTSTGWFIPEESVRGRFSTDALRYALCTMMPETADADWSWKEFQARVNADLNDNLGNFVARSLRFAERFLESELPPLGQPAPRDREILAAAGAAAADMAAAFLRFEFRRACQRLMAFSSECNRYYDEMQPWVLRKQDPARCRQVLRVCAELVHSLAILAAPILPDTAQKVLGAFLPAHDDAGRPSLPPGPLRVQPLPTLFTKVEDKVVEEELARLRAVAKGGTAAAPAAPPARKPDEKPATAGAPQAAAPAGAIAYESFAAVELRAGTVRAARRHPDADKLLVLEVGLGSETRTIVAGIAASYTPEALQGHRVVVVANLAPRKLRGIESQGMLLAADDAEGKPRLLTPGPGTPDGAKVK